MLRPRAVTVHAHTHGFFQIWELIPGWTSTLQGPLGACLHAPASKLDHLGRGSQEERWFPGAPGTSVKRTSVSPSRIWGWGQGAGWRVRAVILTLQYLPSCKILPGLLGIELSLSRDWEHETKEFSTICLIQWLSRQPRAQGTWEGVVMDSQLQRKCLLSLRRERRCRGDRGTLLLYPTSYIFFLPEICHSWCLQLLKNYTKTLFNFIGCISS